MEIIIISLFISIIFFLWLYFRRKRTIIPVQPAPIAVQPAPIAEQPAPIINVIILGAGPVGLHTAIKILDKGLKNINIVILEARNDMELTLLRNQALFVTNAIFAQFPSDIKSALLSPNNGCVIYRPPYLLNSKCYKKINIPADDEYAPYKSGYSIKINTLQKIFLDYLAKYNNCKIIYGTQINKITDKNIIYNSDNTMIYDYLYISVGNINKINGIYDLPDVELKFEPIHLRGIRKIGDEYVQQDYPFYDHEFKCLAISMKVSDDINQLLDINDSPDDYYMRVVKGIRNQTDEVFHYAQSRFCFFRQQKDDIYLGINLYSEEYNELLSKFGGNFNKTDIVLTTNDPVYKWFLSIISMYTNINIDKLNNNINIPKNNLSLFTNIPSNINYPILRRISNYNIYIIGDAAISTHFFSGMGINLGIKYSNVAIEHMISLINGDIITEDKYKKMEEDMQEDINILWQRCNMIYNTAGVKEINYYKSGCDKKIADNYRKNGIFHPIEFDMTKIPDLDVCMINQLNFFRYMESGK